MIEQANNIQKSLEDAKVVIADPLFQPICPNRAKFIPLPSEAFSGRLYRKDIPNLIDDFETFWKELLV